MIKLYSMRNIYGSPLPLHPVAVAVAVATVNGGVKAPLLTSMAKFCDRNRARSRRNPCRQLVRSFLTTLRGPRPLCRASARCGA